MATIAATGYPWIGSVQAQGYGYEQSRYYLSAMDVTLWRYDASTFILWRADLRRLDFVINNRTVATVGCYPPVQGQYFTNGPVHLLGQLFETPHIADRVHQYGGWIQYEPLAERMRIGVGAPPATAMELYGNGNLSLADLVEDPKGEAESGLPVTLFSGLLHLSSDGRLVVEALYEGYRLFLQGEIGSIAAISSAIRATEISAAAEISELVAQSEAAWILAGAGAAEIEDFSADGAATILRKLPCAADLGSCEAESASIRAARVIGSASCGSMELSARLYAFARGSATIGSGSASGQVSRARAGVGAGTVGGLTAVGRAYRYARAGAEIGGLAAAVSTAHFRLLSAQGAPAISGLDADLELALLRLVMLPIAGDLGPLACDCSTSRIAEISATGAVGGVRAVGFADRCPNAQRQFYRVRQLLRSPGASMAVAVLESVNRPVDR